jgi:hypothetical protein
MEIPVPIWAIAGPPQIHPVIRREAYNDNKSNPEALAEVFDTFQHWPIRYKMTDLLQQSKVRLSTLYRWMAVNEKDPSWRPDRTHYKGSRTFTEEQEEALAERLRQKYIANGVFCTRSDLQRECLDFWKSFPDDQRIGRESFSATRCFVKKNQAFGTAFAVPSGGGNSRSRTFRRLKNKPQKKFQTLPYIGYIA